MTSGVDFDSQQWLRDYQHLLQHGWAVSGEAAEDEHGPWITAMRERLSEDRLLASLIVIYHGPRGTGPGDWGWARYAFIALARLQSPAGDLSYPDPSGFYPDYQERRRKIIELAERDWGTTLVTARLRVSRELTRA